ncbi:hypothetical protein [Priestia endophytica]|uniref:hypothetical protein n=1 Tax=Priestia endophytica TaxID=135735 RepID=UPI000FAE3910|nr:hypothetical protein [Priestia endophytica]RPK08313.1 hypothetical protein FH5_04943 [Priestia endophytica]
MDYLEKLFINEYWQLVTGEVIKADEKRLLALRGNLEEVDETYYEHDMLYIG